MKSQRGFTLIELLVVISIISVLSSIVMGSLNTARAKARDAQRVSDVHQIRTALELYYLDRGNYPNITDGISNDTGTCSGPLVEGGSAVPQVAGCGHCNRWCYLGDALKDYISPLPQEPLGASVTYRYAFASNTGNNRQTYGLYATLETSIALAQNDGGYFPTAGGGTRNAFEVGPQVGYCMNKYTGTDRDWLGGKTAVGWDKVCAGGN